MSKEQKLETLRRLYDRAMDKVFAMSANYLMTIPRKGCETEWQDAKDEADTIAGIINDYV